TGGQIITTPSMNRGITNRGMLALGGYTGLQAYSSYRIAPPRSLPTAGKGPLLDSQEALQHPQSCQSANIVVRQDVRYVVLYKDGNGAGRQGPAANLPGFAADPAHYRRGVQDPAGGHSPHPRPHRRWRPPREALRPAPGGAGGDGPRGRGARRPGPGGGPAPQGGPFCMFLPLAAGCPRPAGAPPRPPPGKPRRSPAAARPAHRPRRR